MKPAQCAHTTWQPAFDVTPIYNEGDMVTTGYIVAVQIRCAGCGTFMTFLGMDEGVDSQGPAINEDGRIARLGAWPEGSAVSPFYRHRDVTERGKPS